MIETQDGWRVRVILFFVSQCITLLGSQVVQMAVIWYVTLQADSGAWIAAFSISAYLPQFFISFLGGVWADRYHRKWLIVGADIWIAAATLGMLAMMPHITAEPVLLSGLLLMSVIRSAGAGIQNPAVNAVIAQLVPQQQRMRYNGMNAAMQSAVQFGAPAVAAVVLTMSSLREALLIDIWTAAIGMSIFACIRLPKQEKVERRQSVYTDMYAGIRYAHACRPVRKTLTIYSIFIFLTVPAGYLSGLLVSRLYGDTYWHLTAVELAGFGGMMAGGLLMTIWGGFRNHGMTLSLGLALFGVMAMAMGVSRYFVLYLVWMALYGVALTMVQTTLTTMLQMQTEQTIQGRVFGLMNALYASCYPLGMAIFGPLADWMPLQGMMIFSGVVLMMTAGTVYCGRHASN
ncbi:MAG: MFS transporter [Clostridia bacterium]|nr:MFS transporter [Clostridia bacterium]